MKRLRSPSLFWTFAGSFLAVLLLAVILQVVIVVAIIEPMAVQWVESRAETVARETASEIAAGLVSSTEHDIIEILHRHRQTEERRIVFLGFRYADGRVIIDPPRAGRPFDNLQRGMRDSLDFPGFPAFDPFRGHGARDTLGERRDWGRLPGHLDSAAADTFHDFPWEGRIPPPNEFNDRRGRLFHYPVQLETRIAGTVFGVVESQRSGLWPVATPRPFLLTLPIAVLLAGSAGLIMFRSLLKRLRALEHLATRVTEGDLETRVLDLGVDEIGQLGARLNRMTESLAEAKQHIIDNDNQRRRFLADISHELATPLTSIRGYTETLLEPMVSVSGKERVAYLHRVLEESKRMDLLIQDLLDLTRLEAGAIVLQQERLDWTALCRNTIDRFADRFTEIGLKLVWSGPADPAWIVADGRRLEQVLENLLINALRYVPSGGTVTGSLERIAEQDRSYYRLVLCDNGPGFPSDDLSRVFDRFYRADEARSTGGTGLGLAIVQEIIRLHGGEVRASNMQPSGAAITIELPVD
jgi:signal transduction histidine kinase